MVRAACGFESEYVREDALDFRLTVGASVYMRVLIAAARPKKFPSGTFLHVSAGRTQSACGPGNVGRNLMG